MEILKDKTKSICPECFKELQAMVYEEGNQVFLVKECPEHGKFEILIEKDAEFYKRIMHKEFRKERIPFLKLALPITHQCNLSCQVCYAPDRENKDFSVEELRVAIQDFKGRLIKLTGGEPTLSKNLLFLIETIHGSGKVGGLVTNGINLTNTDYVKILKKAGLKQVAIAFHGGFRDDIYEKINGQKLLKEKLKALKNLKKAGMEVVLSVTLVRGVNEDELAKIYRYYLNNKSFIKLLRIRSLSQIGRYVKTNPFCLSEIIDLMSKASGFTKEELIEPFFQYHPLFHYSTCRFRIDLHNSFIYRINKQGIQNKRFRKIRFILESLSLFGVRKTVEMIINKIKGKKRLLDAEIAIRIWPDKERIDFGEIQYCPTAILTSNREFLPFCYGIIMEEKSCLL